MECLTGGECMHSGDDSYADPMLFLYCSYTDPILILY